MKNTISNLQQGYCTGCGACAALCPKQCIQMEENQEGFWNASIRDALCVKCGLCVKICPQLSVYTTNYDSDFGTEVFLSYQKDHQKQRESTSGGVFSAIAETVLKKSGVVCGAALVNGREVRHILVDTLDDLKYLKGSKYVQSQCWDILPQIKRLLENGKLVLFSGTPCQVSGLLRFLRQPYDNLYTIDLICHGVPSGRLFRKHIEYLESKVQKRIVNYVFRDHSSKWQCIFDDGTIQKGWPFQDTYYSGFQFSSTLNEACYKCQYAKVNRMGDITLGDFWGAEYIMPNFFSEDGNSAVIISTEKGAWLFRQTEDILYKKKSDRHSVSIENPSLRHPVTRPQIRDRIYDGLDAESDYFVQKKYIISPMKVRIKQAIASLMPRKLKKYIKLYLKNIGFRDEK